MVQREIARRSSQEKYHSGTNCFSSKIICGCCGSAYGSKVWHSTDQYRRVIWQCNRKYKNGQKCTTPHLDEDTIKRMFVQVVNRVLVDREQILKDCDEIRLRLSDTTALETQASKLRSDLNMATEQIRQLVERNASSTLDQLEYEKQYQELTAVYQDTANQVKGIEEQIGARKLKGEEIAAFVAALMNAECVIPELDEKLWNALVEKIVVLPKENPYLILRNGKKVSVNYFDQKSIVNECRKTASL